MYTVLWVATFSLVLAWSALDPKDGFTWLLEALPALVGAAVLLASRVVPARKSTLAMVPLASAASATRTTASSKAKVSPGSNPTRAATGSIAGRTPPSGPARKWFCTSVASSARL